MVVSQKFDVWLDRSVEIRLWCQLCQSEAPEHSNEPCVQSATAVLDTPPHDETITGQREHTALLATGTQLLTNRPDGRQRDVDVVQPNKQKEKGKLER